MKLTDENKAVLTGALLALIFAAMFCVGLAGAVHVGWEVFGTVTDSVSGYGLDEVAK